MSEAVLDFAQQEWTRYAGRMDPSYAPERVSFRRMKEDELKKLDIGDTFWDDAYRLNIVDGSGEIIYANERSALLGVYHLLREAGCAFLHPGPMGEVVPRKQLDKLNAQKTVRAANRHRGICIEGSVSLENVLDMIDYAPKAGYNAYFTQFREAYTFFERWYAHRDNPLYAGEEYPVELARQMQETAVKAIKRRGLLYHAVGHGWTCEALGIHGLSWEAEEKKPEPWQKAHMALVNGERGLSKGVALNTNLCYSAPETRTLVAREIADYAQKHPQIDVLHVWLADEANNHCECDACAARRPSDWYVMMLNEAAQLLKEKGLATHIVFLIYYDLLFPPEEVSFIEEDRFILMYAPITRSFAHSFNEVTIPEGISEYWRNRLTFSRDVGENLAYLKAWQAFFKGDSFDYDYHLFYGPNIDLGQMTLCRVLYEDIGTLSSMGLNGMVHCQLQRVAMPHGFGLFMAGQALLDPTTDYDSMQKRYFDEAFGEDGEKAAAFCQKLSELFPMDAFAGIVPHPNPTKEELESIKQLNAEIEGMSLTHAPCQETAQEKSWAYLAFWKACVKRLTDYVIAVCEKRADSTEKYDALAEYVWNHEPEVQSVFDAYCFLRHYRRIMG